MLARVCTCQAAIELLAAANKPPLFSLSIYEYIPSPLGNCSSVSNSKDRQQPHMRLGTVSEISGEIRITRYAIERKMDFSMFSYV
jgi:hypothetical protein